MDLPADKMSLKEKAKDWVALDQLERVQSDPKDLKLKIYFHKYEKDKKISRYWLFRMRNLKLIT